jgi:hypothetical protein
MRGIRLELAKLRRNRLWLTVVLVIGIESAWAGVILFVSLTRDPAASSFGPRFAVAQVSQVHAIFAPVLATVLASRLAAIEHDGRMMPALFAANQPRGALFRAKFFVAWTICGTASIIVVALVALVCSLDGAGLDAALFGSWLGGLIAAVAAVVAVQLALSLSVERQAVALTIGIVGGFAGSFAGFVPPAIALFVPWQYAGVVTPVRLAVSGGRITGFPLVADLGWIVAVVCAAGVVCAIAGQAVFSRTVSR